MVQRYESVADFITRFKVALGNAQANPEIMAALGLFGFDAPKFAEGQALVDDLEAKAQLQQTEYAEKVAVTEALNTAWQEANKTYGVHRAIAKRVFKDNQLAWGTLALNEPKPNKRSDWLQQTGLFYKNLIANAAFVAEMLKFGQSLEILQAAQQQMKDFENLLVTQQGEVSEAQVATQSRNEVWDEAKTWLATLLEISKFALADNPQLREALGVVVKE